MIHLPDDAQRVAAAQGWNKDSVIAHLVSYITKRKFALGYSIAQYFVEVAEDENCASALPTPHSLP